MKKVLLTLVMLATLVAALCITASAAHYEDDRRFGYQYFEDYEYYIESNGTLEITKVDSDITGAITIPDTIDGQPVTSIRAYAFSHRDLTSVTIPSSVFFIGAHAFWGCDNLTTVTIPSSVFFIGEEAFLYCGTWKTSYYSRTILICITKYDKLE